MALLSRFVNFFFVLAVFAVVLGACASDDSATLSSESVVISVNSGADTTFSDNQEVTAAYFAEEALPGVVPADSTAIQGGGLGDVGVLLVFPGGATGTFTIGDGTTYLSYVAGVGSAYIASSAFGTSATITVTEYGAVGGLIVGTFEASSVVEFVDDSPANSEATLSGSFNVTRDADGQGL